MAGSADGCLLSIRADLFVDISSVPIQHCGRTYHNGRVLQEPLLETVPVFSSHNPPQMYNT